MIGSGIAERYHQRYFNAVPITDVVGDHQRDPCLLRV